MAEFVTESDVCGMCGKHFNQQLDNSWEWHEGPFTDERYGLEYEVLCPECYEVVVKGAEETRDWIHERLEIRAETT